MRTILCWAAITTIAVLGWSADVATPAKKKTPPRKTAAGPAASAPKKAPAKTGAAKRAAPATKKRAAASKTTAGARTTAAHPSPTKAGARTTGSRRGKKGPPAKRITWRNRQLAPTPQRYKEIQDALAAKGYLKPEDATGTWNPASVDALKKFQTGQNLESTGKVNSLSLIALGLGPKRETAPPQPSPEVTPTPPR
jgi:hypothetical protein